MYVVDGKYNGMTRDNFENFIISSFKLVSAEYTFKTNDIDKLIKKRFKLRNKRIGQKEFKLFLEHLRYGKMKYKL